MTNDEEEETVLLSSNEESPDVILKFSETETRRWIKKEKYVWFLTLLFGSLALYATRTTMPLVSPSCAKSLNWSKTEAGTVLSSFFWGYTLTQILGGYLSDKYGAEKVMFIAGTVWALLNFWFQHIITWAGSELKYVVFARVLFGAAQGFHFPSLASISSKNLNSKDRGFFFSATTAGSAFGVLTTGTIGSLLNETLGWPSVFYFTGIVAIIWLSVLKYCMNLTSKNHAMPLSSSSERLPSDSSPKTSQVPWLLYLKSPSLWACAISHYCHANCFFILMSWLPTYFHDNFPEAKSWIFNVVPYFLMAPGIVVGWMFSNKLIKKGYSVGSTRKICEGICLLTEAFCLVCIGLVSNFTVAVLLCTLALFSKSFHNFGSSVNSMDIAPKHSGSIFGIINAIGCTAGFTGVYFAGYILELTGSWPAIFNATAVVNVFGLLVFVFLGSGEPIV